MVDINTNTTVGVGTSVDVDNTTDKTTNKSVNRIAAEQNGFVENKDERTKKKYSVRATWKARQKWNLVRKLYVDWNDACEKTGIGTYSNTNTLTKQA